MPVHDAGPRGDTRVGARIQQRAVEVNFISPVIASNTIAPCTHVPIVEVTHELSSRASIPLSCCRAAQHRWRVTELAVDERRVCSILSHDEDSFRDRREGEQAVVAERRGGAAIPRFIRHSELSVVDRHSILQRRLRAGDQRVLRTTQLICSVRATHAVGHTLRRRSPRAAPSLDEHTKQTHTATVRDAPSRPSLLTPRSG